jgi:hypothetical protein
VSGNPIFLIYSSYASSVGDFGEIEAGFEGEANSTFEANSKGLSKGEADFEGGEPDGVFGLFMDNLLPLITTYVNI